MPCYAARRHPHLRSVALAHRNLHCADPDFPMGRAAKCKRLETVGSGMPGIGFEGPGPPNLRLGLVCGSRDATCKNFSPAEADVEVLLCLQPLGSRGLPNHALLPFAAVHSSMRHCTAVRDATHHHIVLLHTKPPHYITQSHCWPKRAPDIQHRRRSRRRGCLSLIVNGRLHRKDEPQNLHRVSDMYSKGRSRNMRVKSSESRQVIAHICRTTCQPRRQCKFGKTVHA